MAFIIFLIILFLVIFVLVFVLREKSSINKHKKNQHYTPLNHNEKEETEDFNQ